MIRISAADHARVRDAITSAERNTSGEIYCVLSRGTDDYRAVPFAYAALAALVLPPLLLVSGMLSPALLASGDWAGWDDRSGGIQAITGLYAALSSLLFLATFLLVRIPAARRRLTPASLRRAAVHRAAMESFLAHGIHVTQDRTGVLIFLSEDDHMAEIVADESIYTKVSPDIWGDAVSVLLDCAREHRIADGFVAAVEKCGNVLAAHFPPGNSNPNELPDRLIET